MQSPFSNPLRSLGMNHRLLLCVSILEALLQRKYYYLDAASNILYSDKVKLIAG